MSTDIHASSTRADAQAAVDAQPPYQQSRDKYVESFTNYEVKKREYLQATGR